MAKKILAAIVLLALVLTIPSLIERIQAELANDTYEVVLPYDQVEEMTLLLQESETKEEIYQKLIDAGVTSISVEPIRISDLLDRGLIEEVKPYEIVRNYPEIDVDLPEIPGLFLRVYDEDSVYVQELIEAYNFKYSVVDTINRDVETIRLENDVYLFLPYEMKLLNRPLGFHEGVLTELDSAGFSIVPRLENTYEQIEYDAHYLYDDLKLLSSEYGAHKILFLGQDVIGAGDPQELKQFATQMAQLDFLPIMIDLNDQIGMERLVQVSGMEHDVIRLFSMTLGKGTERSQAVTELNKGVRAYKERNIRMLFVNPLNRQRNQAYHSPDQAKDGLEGTIAFVESLTTSLGTDKLGTASPFASFSQSTWTNIVTLIGVSAFIALFIQSLVPKLTIVAFVGMLVLSALYVLTGMDMLMKGIALLVAVVAALYAVLAIKQVPHWQALLKNYLLAILIALTGAWLVVQLLYGTEFLTKVDYFRGIKVLTLLPVIVGGCILFGKFIISLLGKPIRYWHLIILVIVGGILAYDVMRSGNAGTALPFELAFRQGLEDLLYVRPRMSEFLIGLPLFLLGLYFMKLRKVYAPLFLVFGFVAFSSMVGTFTHLHTPIHISALRTLYSVVLGAIIGGVLIAFYELVVKKIVRAYKLRWAK